VGRVADVILVSTNVTFTPPSIRDLSFDFIIGAPERQTVNNTTLETATTI
jgi:hypothetical protein